MAEKSQEESEYKYVGAEELEEFETYYEEKGFEQFAEFMANKIKEVENVPVKIAVTGISGTGKSAFVNTFRGLNADNEGAAKVGSLETTMVPTEYRHPNNKNVTLWDLPGVGTSKFNKDNYEEKVNFDSYDFFLIFTRGRIFEDDIWLAKRAQLRGKNYFIVRTHIDVDMKGDKSTHPHTHDANKLLKEIRDGTKRLLEEVGVYPKDGVYLISTLLKHVHKDLWDYRKLENDMLHKLPREKREVLTLSLNNLSKNLIKEKCEILRSRLKQKAMLLALKGFVPSGLKDFMPQEVLDFIDNEMTSYRQALGLDDGTLRRLSQRTGIELESLISETTEIIEMPTLRITGDVVMMLMACAIDPVLIVHPAISFFSKLGVGFGVAYESAYRLLHDILGRLETASLRVIEKMPSTQHTESLKATLSSTPYGVLYDRTQGGDDEA
ncbi:T-cell-specific guanine nucleotide triphosphate-binding protein 1-like [Lingula anatina]|uniref:T-cell-specific guanine nucleotide triphosphate-binding protein 1-like n=1 Tax=Lingula anatina TaxID=7574 RepID=A0A1S3HHH3_LINAN|nr:T-cell-specific guanine nucleotide triphosphate-binding protein 1-like [Lingula anatina]|eukprot:XP_013385553.1 T-cell-specific guanine nucleotide triphosphate-binding protein 1-like [Lingula anatina]